MEEKHKATISIYDDDEGGITVDCEFFSGDQQITIEEVAEIQSNAAPGEDSMVFIMAERLIAAAKFIFRTVEEGVEAEKKQPDLPGIDESEEPFENIP